MASRTYSQFCGVAHALDLVGERWALLVVRELLLGPRRFTDLSRSLPGIGSNILSSRLKQLEQGGVVQRRTLPPPAASTVYELTEYGRELKPVLVALGRWGAKTIGERREQILRPEWLAMAMLGFFNPDAAEGLGCTCELRFDGATFNIRIADGNVQLEHGSAERPDLVVELDGDALIALLSGQASVGDLLGTEALSLEGAKELLEPIVRSFRFPRPEPVTQD